MAKTKTDINSKTRIAIIDDHPIVRQGLSELICHQSEFIVCGEAEDAPSALRMVEASRPDVAIVDISLKDSSGIELIKDLKVRFPKILILVLSMHDESFYAERVLRAGARGYVTKEEATECVITAIRKLLDGGIYLSELMASRMLSKFVEGPSDAGGLPVDRLTDRELQVFELVGRGISTRQIAQKLHLSIKTVESHRENIKRKLKLDNATELLQHAVKWVQIEQSG